MQTLSVICLFLPLAGTAVLALLNTRITRESAAWLGTAVAFVSFLAAVAVFFQILGEGQSQREHVFHLYTWAASPSFTVPFTLQIDPLSVTEMLIVSGVGSLIVMYSIGYLHGDPKQRRFFAYLDLFLFSMLLLVMAGDFVLLLAGWGLVGLSSYLLIGFWHERPEPVAAAKKAFVMNAVGDIGIAIAIFFMVRDIGTTQYGQVFSQAPHIWAKGSEDANWVALLLLVGAVAKSAQIPLHTWLPDAMEGPTPVSALIHAATMVTAGVYLVARAHPLFENAPNVMATTALLGVATLLMAGVIAIVQTDIKRIIAYSTMSQIGYMFTAVGIGAYSAGMFHLLTHAFFKALLFLGAGIVIHALADEQDVRKMGGLAAALPRTKVLMWVGTIALIGFWPTSKDQILAASMEVGTTTAWIVWVGGLIGALLTGIYATRLMRLVFYGEQSEFVKEHLHEGHGEAPWVMFWPVAALAAGAILSGFLSIGFGAPDYIADFLSSAIPNIESTVGQDVLSTIIAWGLGAAGGFAVWRLYDRPGAVPKLRQRFSAVATVAEHKFYWDELYTLIAYRPAQFVAVTLDRVVERWIIAGSITALTVTMRDAARGLADAQSGIVRQYAAVFAFGVVIVGAYLLGEGEPVTVAMLILPLVVAAVLALAPLERRAAEGLALAGALAEVALGAVALVRFDTGGGLQFVTDRVWISDLYGNVDVRFHIGMDGLSLFMVLLVAVGIAAAVASAMRAQRQKPRAYLALLLLLECALVLLFTAQNLALFYVGWEAMMIPLYVLMAAWGGEGRRRATLTFFIYTLIGSLLMLVAIAAIGIDQGTFERSALIGRADMPTWQFFALAAAFCIKAPLFPLHGWMPAAYRQSTSEVSALLSGVISKAGAYGLLAFALPLFDSSARDWRWLFLGLALTGLLYGSLVAFRQPDARGVIAYSSLGQMNLIVIGIFAFNSNGSAGATFQMVNHGIVSLAAFLLIGLIELRTHTDAFKYLGGLANGRPVLSTIFLIAALWALAVPGSSVFVSELYVLIGAFQQAAWLGVLASFTIVLAAMYMLRWYSALVHGGDGERVRPDLPDLKPFELGVAVPLVLILLAMSFYPFGVMQRLQTALPTTPIPTLFEASR